MYCFIWNIDYPTVSQKLNLRRRKSRSNWPSCWGGFELTSTKTQSQLTASHNSLRFCFPPIQSYLRYFQQPSTRRHIHSFHSFSHMFILSLKHCTAGRQSFSPKNQFIRQKKGKDKKNARIAAWLAQLGVRRSAGSPRVRTRPDQHSANG